MQRLRQELKIVAAFAGAGEDLYRGGLAAEQHDAGIGAAGALMLVSVGSGTVLVRRRRMHQPLPS